MEHALFCGELVRQRKLRATEKTRLTGLLRCSRKKKATFASAPEATSQRSRERAEEKSRPCFQDGLKTSLFVFSRLHKIFKRERIKRRRPVDGVGPFFGPRRQAPVFVGNAPAILHFTNALRRIFQAAPLATPGRVEPPRTTGREAHDARHGVKLAFVHRQQPRGDAKAFEL